MIRVSLSEFKEYAINAALIIAGSGLMILQWHNVAHYPVQRGFDTKAHIHYLNFIKNNHQIPDASQGWETHQQPLYYILGSLLPTIQSVKYLHLLYYAMLLIGSYLFLKTVFKQQQLALLGTIIIGSLPVIVSLTPPISNEFFSTVMISLALMYYVLNYKLQTNRQKIILGILLGLAIASKATALLVVVTIIIDQVWQAKLMNKIKLKTILLSIIIVLSVAFIIGGGNYLRHFMVYGNPVIASHDLAGGNPFPQDYVARDWKFFTDLSGFGKMDLFRAQHYSFIAGTYFSWFYDAHNLVIPVQEFSKAGAVLILLSLPILVLSFVGLYKGLQQKNTIDRTFLIYTLLLCVSYIMYNFRLPYYSTVKGAFIASLAVPFVYFFLQGLKTYEKRLLTGATLYMIVYTAIIIRHFWILDWWY